jgi:dUTPase
MSVFEKVSRFADVDIDLPIRKTEGSAGYDFIVAEDIIVPSYHDLMYCINNYEIFELLQ